MEMVPLVPAPVVVLVGVETDDGVGDGAAATEVLRVQVGAASASGKMAKRESAVENMTEGENGKGNERS